jgi:type III restriction enzyme
MNNSALAPRGFQIEKSAELTTEILAGLGRQRRYTIVYKAPTGSGKTLTLSWALRDAKDRAAGSEGEARRSFIVVWVCIGRGDLEVQSAESMSRVLPRVFLLDDVRNADSLQHGDVIAVNWEKLKAKRKGGTKIRFDEDMPNRLSLRTIVREVCGKRGWDVVLVIDESHEAADSALSQEIIEKIGPKVVVEASATPGARLPDRTITVEHDEARVAGLVKMGIRVNEGLERHVRASDEDGLYRALLECGVNRRDSLHRAHRAEGGGVTPLLLVQVESGWESAEKIVQVREALRSHGLTVEGGTLAIWLSESKVNLDGIQDADSPVKALIFKQAIATGWDCPRASVLVQLRDVQSEVLQLQTLGRIYRRPEPWRADEVTGRCYDSEELEYGYVYTNTSSPVVHPDEPRGVFWTLATTRDSDLYKPVLDLRSVSRAAFHPRGLPPKDAVLKALTLAWAKKPISDVRSVPRSLAHGIDAELTVQAGGKADIRTVDVALDDNETNSLFRRVVRSMLHGFPATEGESTIVPAIEEAIFQLLPMDAASVDVAHARAVFINNRDLLGSDVAGLVKAEWEAQREQAEDYTEREDWEVPETRRFSNRGNNLDIEIDREDCPALHAFYRDGDRCYCVPKASGPEERFLSALRRLPDTVRLVWWWKNGEDDECLGIKYRNAKGDPATFYPDFLVMARVNGRKVLGIFETKDDQDDDPDTPLKAEALREYLAAKPSRAGLTVVGDVLRVGGGQIVGQVTGKNLAALLLDA